LGMKRVRSRALMRYKGKYRSLMEFTKHSSNSDVRQYNIEGINIILHVTSNEVKEYKEFSEILSRTNTFEKAYLMGSYYSGAHAKAYLRFYDDENDKVYEVYDVTGHMPYFLTDEEPDRIKQMRNVVNDKSFSHLEVVRKYDLLRGKEVRLTKVVVKDPQAVRRLRNYFKNVWEAKIKYHDNYIFDNGLIPGMVYKASKGLLKEVEVKIPKEVIELFESAVKDLPEDLKRNALRYVPLFEARPPKIRRLAIDIEVYTPFKGRIPDAVKTPYPVISIALTSNDGLRKVLLLGRDGVEIGDLRKIPSDYEVEIFDSERALILEAFRIINDYPLILTFNGDEFDLPYLHNRAMILGIEPELNPIVEVRDFVSIKHGFHIDLYKFFSIEAIQNYAFGSAYKEKTLDAIAQALLGEAKIKLEEAVGDISLSELAEYNATDSSLTLKLTTFNDELVWKLIILIMRLAKMSLEDVTRRKVSAWIKNLMYWEHRRRNYLIPNEDELLKIKGVVKTSAKIGGKRYAGAIVIDPIPGVYFNVVVLDFASLYPSIIKVWNLSYETIDPLPEFCKDGEIGEIKDESGRTLHKVCLSRKGITSELVGMLRDFRVNIYKKLAKRKDLPSELRSWYDVVQSAMKVYINASYGVFGHEKFPLYTPSVAESVTALGRYVITSTLKKAKELGLKVLYGDTDSLFLWKPDERKLNELIKWVEEKFQLDLEVDKVYKYVAFALKKNYIGVQDNGKVDIKGMVGKKKNVPKLLQDTFIKAVNLMSDLEDNPVMLSKVKNALKNSIQEVYLKLKNREFTLDEVAFRTTLNKPLEEYVKTTPIHVKAAKQLRKYGVMVSKGDVIFYVKTKTRDKVKAVQLAKLDDVNINEYVEALKSVIQQLLIPFGIEWEEIAGSMGLYNFFKTYS